MALGYSHPVVFKLPKGVTAKVEKNKVTLTSADRDLVGQTAAKVRELRPPEPYKGKGVKYVEEVIKKKVGKAGATGSGGGVRPTAEKERSTCSSTSVKKAEPQEAASLAAQAHRGDRGAAAPGGVPQHPPHLRPGHRRSQKTTLTAISDKVLAVEGADEGRQEGARQEGRRRDRQAVPREGDRQGRVRPRRLQVPRARLGARRRRARSRAEVLEETEKGI